MLDLLNDLWTPDVKATQLLEVISGVSPIRSVVNVGSGVADLILLPIAQYKKDGRIVRGAQKGTKAFVKSTAMEAIKLGAQLATGTQVILEQAEHILGGHFSQSITAETMQTSPRRLVMSLDPDDEDSDDADPDLISRYAEQPADVTEGVQSAYRSMRRNLNSAAQTIFAVPMEVADEASLFFINWEFSLLFIGSWAYGHPSHPGCCFETHDRSNRGCWQDSDGPAEYDGSRYTAR